MGENQVNRSDRIYSYHRKRKIGTMCENINGEMPSLGPPKLYREAPEERVKRDRVYIYGP